jgi:hypothetical protein
MELVDMNSLGLFNFFLILSVQVGFTLYYRCNISYVFIYSLPYRRLFFLVNEPNIIVRSYKLYLNIYSNLYSIIIIKFIIEIL